MLTELLSAVGVASNVQSSPACNGRSRGTASLRGGNAVSLGRRSPGRLPKRTESYRACGLVVGILVWLLEDRESSTRRA